MKRSLLFTSLALGALGLGVLYGRLTQAAPEPALVPSGPAASAWRAPHRSTAANVVVTAPAPPSPETERLEARRQLYESVDALVQASEFEKARKLLDRDVERYGDDLAPEWHDLEQSYRLMADCLEHPSPQLRVRAEAFVMVSQALSLKSRILAACRPKSP